MLRIEEVLSFCFSNSFIVDIGIQIMLLFFLTWLYEVLFWSDLYVF